MRTIYKYEICYAAYGDSINEIDVPVGAAFLKLARQRDKICAWFVVDSEQEQTEKITWYQIGTGHEIYPGANHYVDSVVCDDYGLVWHIFTDCVLI